MAIETMVLFLRGINVGGRHKVPMPDLRDLLDDLDLGPSRTHLQSGNAVVRARVSASTVEKKVSQALEDEFEFAVPAVTRTAAEMASVVERNPYGKAAKADPKSVAVLFLWDEPDAARVADVEADRWADEDWTVDGRELYVHYREGMARSKLTVDDVERQLGVAATARNWNTVTAMAEQAEDAAGGG